MNEPCRLRQRGEKLNEGPSDEAAGKKPRKKDETRPEPVGAERR